MLSNYEINIVSRLKTELEQYGVTEPLRSFIVTQAILETGKFTSNLFKNDNNCGGMKIPFKRKSKWIKGTADTRTPVNETGQYAKYDTIGDSVKDIYDLLKYSNKEADKIKYLFSYAAQLQKMKYYSGSPINYYNILTKYFNHVHRINNL